MMSSPETLKQEFGLISEADVCILLGITIGTLRNWRMKGRGPRYVKATTARALVQYRAADVKAYLAANIVDPAKKSCAPTLADPHARRRQRVVAAEVP